MAYVALTEPSDDAFSSTILQFLECQNRPPKWPLTAHDLINRFRRSNLNQLINNNNFFSEDGESSTHNFDGDFETDSRLWYHCSDSKISKVSLDTVLNCQPYLLFYERIS